MQIFFRVCLLLLIIGGVNWGLFGLLQFDLVGWLVGGSSSIPARIIYTLVGAAAVCAVPHLFGSCGRDDA